MSIYAGITTTLHKMLEFNSSLLAQILTLLAQLTEDTTQASAADSNLERCVND